METIYLSRSRLLNRLKVSSPLVYIYGPVGSGKTVLLQEWSHLQNEQVMWLTCSEIDNDPLCLWQRITHIVGMESSDVSFIPGLFSSTIEVAVVSRMKWVE